MFDINVFKNFHYCGFEVNGNNVSFNYLACGVDSVDNIEFCEKLVFDSEVPDTDVVNRLLNLLGSVLGISYYKIFAGKDYVIDVSLTEESFKYLNILVKYGLAEFAYVNNFSGLLCDVVKTNNFYYAQKANYVSETKEGVSLVAVGGGKDSIVSLEILKQAGIDFKCFVVNPDIPHFNTVKVSGKDLVSVKRVLDLRLFELNSVGALNGHVPVTAFNSIISVVQSYISGYGLTILSNELSSNVETLIWNGEKVNHQWSKSSEAEYLLNESLFSEAGVKLNVFSILRNKLEINIAEAYTNKCKNYDDVIVSCNRAYRIEDKSSKWCGDCDKCRFVGLMFAPYMSSERLKHIVGFSLFEQREFDKYLKLVESSGKPFECVGDIFESRLAFRSLLNHTEWNSNPVVIEMNNYIDGLGSVDCKTEHDNVLPYPFKEAVDVFFK